MACETFSQALMFFQPQVPRFVLLFIKILGVFSVTPRIDIIRASNPHYHSYNQISKIQFYRTVHDRPNFGQFFRRRIPSSRIYVATNECMLVARCKLNALNVTNHLAQIRRWRNINDFAIPLQIRILVRQCHYPIVCSTCITKCPAIRIRF